MTAFSREYFEVFPKEKKKSRIQKAKERLELFDTGVEMASKVAVDPTFSTVKSNQTCIHIWRAEDMALVPIPKEEYGKFFKGDSYLLYSASERGQQAGPDGAVKEVEQFVHFWLGSEISQDKAAVAAIKNLELDDLLGGLPVQMRETEGN